MLILAIVLSIVIGAAIGCIVPLAARVAPWRRLLKRRAVVVLDDGTSLAGVLYEHRGPLVILRDVVVSVDGQTLGADGEVVVERDRIQWIQVVS